MPWIFSRTSLRLESNENASNAWKKKSGSVTSGCRCSAASFRPPTRYLNCSFADRACLATGLVRGLPVVTADRDWASVDLGVEVILFRG